LVLASAAIAIAACGGSDEKLDKPLPKGKEPLTVEAPWRDGGTIPRRYTCDGQDVKPLISTPGAAGPRAIVMTDPDAPGGVFVHWTRWDDKAEGKNSFGTTGYRGPCPPKGDKPHRYVITVYSLSRPLGLPEGAKPDKVLKAITSHAIGGGAVTGTYGR
jgi:phosphatidylethanolamine-binding protein (PEBP) family uncharacterized protein